MNLTKINQFVAGLILIFTGSAVLYYESYRNIEWVDALSCLLISAGWIAILLKFTKNGTAYGKNIAFNQDKAGWFKQRGGRLAGGILLVAIAGGNIYGMLKLAQQRKASLLNNGNTATTTAVIDYIQARRSRGSTSYYAVFQYTINGRVIEHPWYEYKESDFLIGDKYEIKYVVDHPEMMIIVTKLNN